jgi:LPXTG-site transpeptidase (sortase) family protein
MNKYTFVPKFALGVALLILGLVFLFAKPENIISSKTFETEPIDVLELSDRDYKDDEVPKRIIIPSLSIDLSVQKAKIVSGYWEVFDDKAGWGEGSGLPGKEGNQVIFAHAREGLFLPLRSIEVGKRVYVLTDSGWYQYTVHEVKEVFPNQIEAIASTDDETLTLYTCSGYSDSKRLIVIAKPSG